MKWIEIYNTLTIDQKINWRTKVRIILVDFLKQNWMYKKFKNKLSYQIFIYEKFMLYQVNHFHVNNFFLWNWYKFSEIR